MLLQYIIVKGVSLHKSTHCIEKFVYTLVPFTIHNTRLLPIIVEYSRI